MSSSFSLSVVIATHRRPELLPSAVRSVLSQTAFGRFQLEVVVVDDASGDSTPEVVRELDDPRLRLVVRERCGGAAAARNTGIAEAAGEWLLFLDDDDVLLPGFFAAVAGPLATAGDRVGFAWTGRRTIGPDGEVTSEGAWQPEFSDREAAFAGFVAQRHVGASGLMVRRSSMHEVGLFDPGLRKAEDTDLLIRLAHRFDFLVVPEPLIECRVPAGSRLTAYDAAMAEAYGSIVEKHLPALAAYPHLEARLLAKTAWLHFHGGDRRRGRRRFIASLRRRPLRLKTWATWALLELAGPWGPATHRLISRAGSRR